jgi:hypothetical protein
MLDPLAHRPPGTGVTALEPSRATRDAPQLEFERYECKYVVSRDLVRPLQEHIACYTRPDPHTVPGEGYVISSLYLDSPGLTFHFAKARQDVQRVKLRIRMYDDQVSGPIYWEIKRKVKGVIRKRRVRVVRPDWAQHAEDLDALLGPESTLRDRRALEEFFYVQGVFAARPVVAVRYTREAFEGLIDDYARVTFDRRILCREADGYHLPTGRDPHVSIDDPTATGGDESGVVMELKFADRAPLWMIDLVQRFRLRRRGFSKYSTGVERVLGAYRGGHDPRVPTRRSA